MLMVQDASRIDDFFSFDQILLDAPCSGSGTNKFSEQIIETSVKTQKILIEKAIKLLKKGKEMVYSTCSILSCENEEIISKIIEEGKAQIVPIEFKNMEQIPLLPTKIKGTLCVHPTKYYEGFFVAKLRKK